MPYIAGNPPSGLPPELQRYLFQELQKISQNIQDILAGGSGGGGITDAPDDGLQYGRQSLAWTESAPEAPEDGEQYGRQNGSWTVVAAGQTVWGSITGNINLQSDMQNEFVNADGDTMSGALQLEMSGPNIQLKGQTPGPYIDFALNANTDFDMRLQELSTTEFRIQSFSASAKLWAYNFKWFDLGLSTSNVERGVRLLNSQGGVGFINNTGAMRIGQLNSGGVFQESWITAEKNSVVNLFWNGITKLSTDTKGILVRGDDTQAGIYLTETNRNYNAEIYIMDWFQAGAPVLNIVSSEPAGSAWIQTTQPGGLINTFNFQNSGQLVLPAEPNANTSATTKLYVDNAVSDARLKKGVTELSQYSILNLSVYEFEYRDHDYINITSPKFRPGVHFGIMADEVAAIVPEAVYSCPADLDDNGESISGEDYKAVDETAILYLLLAEVKKLNARVIELEGV